MSKGKKGEDAPDFMTNSAGPCVGILSGAKWISA